MVQNVITHASALSFNLNVYGATSREIRKFLISNIFFLLLRYFVSNFLPPS